MTASTFIPAANIHSDWIQLLSLHDVLEVRHTWEILCVNVEVEVGDVVALVPTILAGPN